MEKLVPPWAAALFGEEDANRILEAIVLSLLATENAMLNTHAQAESKHQFAASGARMTNQFDQLEKYIAALEIPSAQIIDGLGVWYKLVIVHNVVLYPYRADKKERVKPGGKWPKKPTQIVKELFAFSPAPSWEALNLDGMESDEKVNLRAALAKLKPAPQLVLIPYVMNLSGLRQAWWGQAALLTESGELDWVGEPASLLLPVRKAKPSQGAEQAAGFDTGDMPEADMTIRPEADRKRDVPPSAERESPDADTVENDEG
ncbi:hypothetical protein AB0F17_37550 [Nonomuraea sp. NPDC026600]|uniref:hypothetical protein n=1 Tax=Nonomuraea sp. NPDC026600 TaxID=3155363 RepID=UPI0033CF241C